LSLNSKNISNSKTTIYKHGSEVIEEREVRNPTVIFDSIAPILAADGPLETEESPNRDKKN
jgi:hypothetical protein